MCIRDSIIGDHIVINEDVFSSEGLEKYERYQCEVLDLSLIHIFHGLQWDHCSESDDHAS